MAILFAKPLSRRCHLVLGPSLRAMALVGFARTAGVPTFSPMFTSFVGDSRVGFDFEDRAVVIKVHFKVAIAIAVLFFTWIWFLRFFGAGGMGLRAGLVFNTFYYL